jgi:hypothetical protein
MTAGHHHTLLGTETGLAVGCRALKSAIWALAERGTIRRTQQGTVRLRSKTPLVRDGRTLISYLELRDASEGRQFYHFYANSRVEGFGSEA